MPIRKSIRSLSALILPVIPVVAGLALVASSSSFSLDRAAPGEARREPDGTPEPSGPLNAGALLVRLTGSGSSLRAEIEMNVLSLLSGAEIRVEEAPSSPPGPARRQALARGRVEKGQRRGFLLERPVAEGQDNHLRFRVVGVGDDGSTQEVSVYLLVPLDESKAPRQMGEYLVYEGVPVDEVRP